MVFPYLVVKKTLLLYEIGGYWWLFYSKILGWILSYCVTVVFKIIINFFILMMIPPPQVRGQWTHTYEYLVIMCY